MSNGSTIFRNQYCAAIKTTLLWIALLLSGCSTLSLTYEYADWLLDWRIKHYVDVTSDQQAYLDTQLTAFIQWHKVRELPRYMAFLKEIKATWRDGLAQQEVDTLFQSYGILWKKLGGRLAADAAPFLITLSPDQIHDLQETIGQDNQELLDRVGRNRHERTERKVKKALDRLEYWLGPLASDQKRHIDDLIRLLPDTFQTWFDNRVRRQSSFIDLLKQQIDEQSLQKEIRDLLISPEKGATLTYTSNTQRHEDRLFATIVAIDKTITSEQREHASGQLELLIQEIQQLTSD